MCIYCIASFYRDLLIQYTSKILNRKLNTKQLIYYCLGSTINPKDS